jgi:hypothetical protein
MAGDDVETYIEAVVTAKETLQDAEIALGNYVGVPAEMGDSDEAAWFYGHFYANYRAEPLEP